MASNLALIQSTYRYGMCVCVRRACACDITTVGRQKLMPTKVFWSSGRKPVKLLAIAEYYSQSTPNILHYSPYIVEKLVILCCHSVLVTVMTWYVPVLAVCVELAWRMEPLCRIQSDIGLKINCTQRWLHRCIVYTIVVLYTRCHWATFPTAKTSHSTSANTKTRRLEVI